MPATSAIIALLPNRRPRKHHRHHQQGGPEFAGWSDTFHRDSNEAMAAGLAEIAM